MDYIVSATKRMQQLIKDMLEYSRVTTKGKEFKPTDTKKSLKSTISDLHGTIEDNKAEIMYDSLLKISADERQLVRLFQNLISNSIKFRKPDIPPKIYISAKKDEENNEYVF